MYAFARFTYMYCMFVHLWIFLIDLVLQLFIRIKAETWIYFFKKKKKTFFVYISFTTQLAHSEQLRQLASQRSRTTPTPDVGANPTADLLAPSPHPTLDTTPDTTQDMGVDHSMDSLDGLGVSQTSQLGEDEGDLHMDDLQTDDLRSASRASAVSNASNHSTRSTRSESCMSDCVMVYK